MIRDRRIRFTKSAFYPALARASKGAPGVIAGVLLAGVFTLLTLPSARSQDKSKPEATSSDSAPAGDVANGKATFMKDGCYHCHGFGAAGTGAAPALLANPIPLESFIAYVRHPARSMPPFTEKVISDKDLTDIFAFIHSLPKPPNVKSIPMLNE